MMPPITPRDCTVPAVQPPGSQAGEQVIDAADGSRADLPSQRGVGGFVKLFAAYLIVSSIAAVFFMSRFSIDLAVFLFFTDSKFIEWALGKTGIRVVPESAGANFIGFFAWLIGLAVLLAYWSASAPAWLSPWLPPPATWWMLAVIAGGIAVFENATTAMVKMLLPRLGIARDSRRWKLIDGFIRLVMLGVAVGVLYLLGSASLLPNWFGGQ
jgi:hypothetical protein